MASIIFSNNRATQLSRFEKLKIWRTMKFLTAKTGSTTWNPPSVANNATTSAQTVTVTGAKVGDEVFAKFSNSIPQGAFLIATVTGANTVSVTLRNNSGGTLDLASGTLSVRVEDRTKYQR